MSLWHICLYIHIYIYTYWYYIHTMFLLQFSELGLGASVHLLVVDWSYWTSRLEAWSGCERDGSMGGFCPSTHSWLTLVNVEVWSQCERVESGGFSFCSSTHCQLISTNIEWVCPSLTPQERSPPTQKADSFLSLSLWILFTPQEIYITMCFI